jgi:hypothetical protein
MSGQEFSLWKKAEFQATAAKKLPAASKGNFPASRIDP